MGMKVLSLNALESSRSVLLKGCSIKKHSFSAVAGQDIEYSLFQSTQASGYGGASDNIQTVTGFKQQNIFAYSNYKY